MNQFSENRVNVRVITAALILMSLLAIPASAVSVIEPLPNPFVPQCDPGKQDYVLETFSLGTESIQVLVTRTASGRFVADREYWAVNQKMLGALAQATKGTGMSLYGQARDWSTPSDLIATFQMPDAVRWQADRAPNGLSWIFRSSDGTTFVGLQFNISGNAGNYAIRSITWYLGAKSDPPANSFVFPPGTTYSLYYTDAPALPPGFRWYKVSVTPKS